MSNKAPVEVVNLSNVATKRGCSVEGCPGVHFGKGFCSPHYQRWIRRGTTDALPKIPPHRKCCLPECQRVGVMRKDMCGVHYRRMMKHGDPRYIAASATLRHGHAKKGAQTAEYRSWQGMLSRCYNPNTKDNADYCARGIKVCERWRESFEDFLADMGPKPSPEHSIDRVNNDGDYEPQNCRWATPLQQARNSRHCRLVSIDGETHTLSEWSEILNVKYESVRTRFHAGKDLATGGTNAA